MYKRGFLLAEETLKMIIAMIVIIALMGLLGKLYYSYQNDKELEKAEATLERLVKEINALTEGETKTVDIFNPVRSGKIVVPDHWILISWPYEKYIPNECSTMAWDSCLCICKNKKSIFQSPKGYKEKCDAIGVCMDAGNSVVQDLKGRTTFIQLLGGAPFKIEIQKSDAEIIIAE